MEYKFEKLEHWHLGDSPTQVRFTFSETLKFVGRMYTRMMARAVGHVLINGEWVAIQIGNFDIHGNGEKGEPTSIKIERVDAYAVINGDLDEFQTSIRDAVVYMAAVLFGDEYTAYNKYHSTLYEYEENEKKIHALHELNAKRAILLDVLATINETWGVK